MGILMKVDSDFFGRWSFRDFWNSYPELWGNDPIWQISFEMGGLKKSINLAIMKFIKWTQPERSCGSFMEHLASVPPVPRQCVYMFKDQADISLLNSTWGRERWHLFFWKINNLKTDKENSFMNPWNWIWTQNWLFFVHSIAVRKDPHSQSWAGWKPKIRKFQVGQLTVLLVGWNLCLRTNMPNCQGGVCFAS